ncbi:MAG: neutral zinc metallopeptidase [Ilumatobacter sp.]|nr:neutral zinc metallopeptidase [Ilumatobacter sp.]MCB0984134.1 neutral zinc metallopeptidase [Ilumatobacter sp.]
MTKIRSTDKSRVKDVRGQSGGGGGGGLGFPFPGMGGSGSGGGGMSFPGGAKAGGGLLGVVVLLAALFLPKLLGAGATQSAADVPASAGSDQCVTELEQIMCGANESVQDYWAAALPQYYGTAYQYTSMVWFTGGVSTGCGQASSETGPFYCPLDSLVYIDLGFMQQLENMLIGTTSDLAEQYIIAHEYGHHVQNLLGTNAQVQRAQQNDPSRANQYSVALELQADCYAGVWVGSNDVLENQAELQEALNAAEGVGDDRIQQKTQGRVDPESWTHGSAEQRRTWFLQGYNSQSPRTCDATFNEITR